MAVWACPFAFYIYNVFGTYYQGLERSSMGQRVARQSREVTPTFIHMRNSFAREQFENYHERAICRPSTS
jgi:hypothetical protein